MQQEYKYPDLTRLAWAGYRAIMKELKEGSFDASKVEIKPSEPPEPLEEGGCRLVIL